MRKANRLSALAVAKLSKPGRYADGGGLYLQVAAGGSKQWILRYMRGRKARHMGLGPVHSVGLAKARERAQDARALLADGLDPIEAREARRAAMRAETAAQISFRDAAEKYITAHRAGWRNPKHADQWAASLETYAFPVIGDLSVASIETAHVLNILEPAWASKTETASRVRGRIEAVLNWAKARGYRQGENPARWRGHLDKLLPSKTKVAKIRHQPAMPYADVPGFMVGLRSATGISARALEFTVLTAVRTGETIGAQWPEIDLSAKVWTIPGVRTKSGRDHRVPLSERATRILADLPHEDGNPHVFVGGRKGKGLSNMAMIEVLRGTAPGLTVHGFRSSFRDWAKERTNHPREIAEIALAHVLKDGTEAAYSRGDALDKRRRLAVRR